ncbi:MAG: hypothetical protein V8S24_15060 [Gordonibacter pamelaeae]
MGFAPAAMLALAPCAAGGHGGRSADDGPAAGLRAQMVEMNAARAGLPDGAAQVDAALANAQDALRAAADARGGLPSRLSGQLAALGAAFAWGVVAYLYVGVVRPFHAVWRRSRRT